MSYNTCALSREKNTFCSLPHAARIIRTREIGRRPIFVFRFPQRPTTSNNIHIRIEICFFSPHERHLRRWRPICLRNAGPFFITFFSLRTISLRHIPSPSFRADKYVTYTTDVGRVHVTILLFFFAFPSSPRAQYAYHRIYYASQYHTTAAPKTDVSGLIFNLDKIQTSRNDNKYYLEATRHHVKWNIKESRSFWKKFRSRRRR